MRSKCGAAVSLSTAWPRPTRVSGSRAERQRECWAGHCREIFLIPGAPQRDFAVTVPTGEYFMLGDNRDNSADSRYWGFLPREKMVGPGKRVLWNLNLAKWAPLPVGDLGRMGLKL